nr:hypothetical protein BaRGS_021487 [Batillaria attramentaria]
MDVSMQGKIHIMPVCFMSLSLTAPMFLRFCLVCEELGLDGFLFLLPGSQFDDCFILFQPELSFAQHDLPDDTPVTNWDNPVTVRDRIRTAFRAAGRSYNIRETILYPMAHDIVKPLFDDDPLVEWWLKE